MPRTSELGWHEEMQLRQLTFLRFIAALGVVVFHYGIHAPALAWGLPFWRLANTAVSFFFFLSGFILTHVYASRPITRRVDFYVARAARILPVYVLALLAAAIFHARRGALDWDSFALNALVIQAWVPGYSQTINSPGWSLSVEVFFYLAFPLLLPAIARMKSGTRLLLLSLGSWTLNLLLHVLLVHAAEADRAFTPLDDFSVYHPLPHLATFVAGMCAARLFTLRQPTCQRWAMPMVVGSVLGLAALAFLPGAVLRYHHNGLFVPLFSLLVVGLAAGGKTALGRLLAWRPLEFLGEISYGVYILQEPAAWFFFAVVAASGAAITPDQQFWLLCLWLITGSALCHLLVEVPMRSLINRGYRALRPAPVTAMATQRSARALNQAEAVARKRTATAQGR
jgi:peptidoglycan/LPS O-acetylase OafA/YrhL